MADVPCYEAVLAVEFAEPALLLVLVEHESAVSTVADAGGAFSRLRVMLGLSRLC